MCNQRILRRVRVCSAALLIPAATLQGQVSVYRAQLDSLTPILLAARHAADSVRALRAALPTDTVRTPHLTLLVDSRVRALVQRGAQLADSDLTRAFGSRADVLRHSRFAIGLDTSQRQRFSYPVLTVWSLDSESRTTRESSEYGTEEAIRARMRNHGAHEITASLDQPLRDWMKRDIASSTADIGNPDDMRSQLVASGTNIGMQCTAGSLPACEKALALTDTRDRITEWFSAAQRRELVTRKGWVWRRGSQVATFDACTDHHDDARCVQLMRAHDDEIGDEGIPSILRMSLLRYSLDRGGDGAFERLMETPGPIGARLAQAARMTQPQLVAAWRDAVLKPDHATEASDPLVLGSSVLWCAACLGLSMRRARWS